MRLNILVALFLSISLCCNNMKERSVNCFDKNIVLERVDKMFIKKTKQSLEDYSRNIVDTTNYFKITYINKIRAINPNMKGNGGMMVKISKTDCKVVDLVIYK